MGWGVKISPVRLPLALLGPAILIAACSTPENRRELYNTSSTNGPWHDYERRLDAAAETGQAPGDMGHAAADPGTPTPLSADGNNTGGTTVVRGGRPTRQSKTAPLAPDQMTLPSSVPAPAAVPSPAGVPSSPISTDPTFPAPATSAPPAAPTSVPVNPPTT